MHSPRRKLYYLIPILSVIAVLMAKTASAQISQPHRFEREQKSSDEYYILVSLKEEGLVVFRGLNKYKSGNRTWEFIHLDTALQEKRSLLVEVNDRNKIIGYEYTPGHFCVLYRVGETTKNDFELIDFELTGAEPKHYVLKPDLDFKLTHFSKAGDSFTFGGYVNNEPAVLLFELPDERISVIPGFFQKDTELVDLRTNQNQTFNTVLVDRGSKEDRKLVFRTYDEKGKLLLEDVVPIDEEKSLQTGLTSTLVREDLAILGTWGERNSKQSIGFYFMAVNPFSDQKIAYIDLGQLNNFLGFLSPKRAERVKANSKEDASNGRIPNYSTYVMPFKVTEYKDGFLILAEVYNPNSNISPYYSNPYYYNPYYSPYGINSYSRGFYYPGMSRMYRPYGYGNTSRNIEDIKTLETAVVSIDGKGKINWDHSFKLEEIKIQGVEQVADFVLVGDSLTILYKKESELNFKTIVINDEVSAEGKQKIKASEAADVIRSEREYEGGVRHWTGNSFFIWGYQTIRNATKEDRVRDVFYVSKVVAK